MLAVRRGQGEAKVELKPRNPLANAECIEHTWIDLADFPNDDSPADENATSAGMQTCRWCRLIDSDVAESKGFREHGPNLCDGIRI